MRVYSTENVAGIWLEFLDAEFNTLAQRIVDDWPGSVPRRGDRLRWSEGDGRALEGIVVARQDDRQHTASGETQTWVRLLVRVCGPIVERRRRAFSMN